MRVFSLLPFLFVAGLGAQSFIYQLCDSYGEYNQQLCSGLQAIQGPTTYPTPPTDPSSLGIVVSNGTAGYKPPLSTLMHNRTSSECTKCTTCGPNNSQCKFGCELTKLGASKELIDSYWGMTDREAPCINSSLQSCQTCENSSTCNDCFTGSLNSYKKCYLKQTRLPENIADSTVECYSKCNFNSTISSFFECSINCYRDVYAYLQFLFIPNNFTLSSQDRENSTAYSLNQFFDTSFCFDPNHSKNDVTGKGNSTITSSGPNHSAAVYTFQLWYQYGFTVLLIILINLLTI